MPCEFQPLEPRTLLTDTPVVIDVMVLYTPRAEAQAGGESIMIDRIHRAVADTNFILANSRVDAAVRLVHHQRVEYDDNLQTGDILDDLLQIADGPLDHVQALRDRHGADLVSLWYTHRPDHDALGRAFRPDVGEPNANDLFAVNIVSTRHAAGDLYVFAHETGHALGAGHERGDKTVESIGLPYAFGHIHRRPDGSYGDIMSAGATYRVPVFSSPDVSYRGTPMGARDKTNNARAVRHFAPEVSAYRAQALGDTRTPGAALGPVRLIRRGRVLRFHVFLADDSAVNAASLSNGDIRIGNANGWSAPARFVKVDSAPGGAQREAIYEVRLPRRARSTAGFTFSVEPSQIRDLSGNAAPAGPIGPPTAHFADRAGSTRAAAYDLGDLTSARLQLSDEVGGGYFADTDTENYYRFELRQPAVVTASLIGIPGKRNMAIIGDPDERRDAELLQSTPAGANRQRMSRTFPRGTYLLRVAVSKRQYDYTLALSTTPVPAATKGFRAPAVAAHVAPPPLPGPTARGLNSASFDDRIESKKSKKPEEDL